MWTVYWSRRPIGDRKLWESDTGISTEPKALSITKAMLLKGWVVYAISCNGKSIWNEARISERCGKPTVVPLLDSQA